MFEVAGRRGGHWGGTRMGLYGADRGHWGKEVLEEPATLGISSLCVRACSAAFRFMGVGSWGVRALLLGAGLLAGGMVGLTPDLVFCCCYNKEAGVTAESLFL